MNELENDDFDILEALYSVYLKNRRILFYTYILINLFNKDTSVLIKVVNIRYKNNGLNFFKKLLCIWNPSNEIIKS